MKVKDNIIELYASKKEFQKAVEQEKLRLPVGHFVKKHMTIAVICRELGTIKKFTIKKVKILDNHTLLTVKAKYRTGRGNGVVKEKQVRTKEK